MDERFSSNGGDDVVQKSQCIDCGNKRIDFGCDVFGNRPIMYAFVTKHTRCPKRIENTNESYNNRGPQ